LLLDRATPRASTRGWLHRGGTRCCSTAAAVRAPLCHRVPVVPCTRPGLGLSAP